MALSRALEVYLVLERRMMALDEQGDPLADQIRDRLDPIWLALTSDEHAYLDRREIGGEYRNRSMELRLESALSRPPFPETGLREEIRGPVGKRFSLSEVLAA